MTVLNLQILATHGEEGESEGDEYSDSELEELADEVEQVSYIQIFYGMIFQKKQMH